MKKNKFKKDPDYLIQDPEKLKRKKLDAFGRLTEGTTMTGLEFFNIINEEGLNKMNHFETYARLSIIDDFFEKTMGRRKPYPLRVFYGYTKLTKKIMKKPAITIKFENSCSTKNNDFINRGMKVIYVREQTEKEMKDGEKSFHTFTKYDYFINEKPWKGDIDGILLDNFYADENNVSESEREHIRDLLRAGVEDFYFGKLKSNYQGSFNFKY